LSHIEEILEHNSKFVAEGRGRDYCFTTSTVPARKIAVLSCMDARLVELLPAALGLKNGDAKIIKNAGAIISHPYGSVMKSLVVAVHGLGVEEILVIGHRDCGMQGLTASKLVPRMKANGVDTARAEVDLDEWLRGFDKVEDQVAGTVEAIKSHPLMPENISVYGFVIEPDTGKLDRVVGRAGQAGL